MSYGYRSPGSRVRVRGQGLALVYLTALLQGLSQVSYPASASVLRTWHGFGDAQYGAMFLPLILAGITGALLGGGLAWRIGLGRLLRMSLLANSLCVAMLGSTPWVDSGLAFGALLVGTASLGLGLGLSAAPLNTYPAVFFPDHSHAAIIALHTAFGLGLAGGPLLLEPFIANERWPLFPLLLLFASLALWLLSLRTSLPEPERRAERGEDGPAIRHPSRSPAFWAFVGVIGLYALAEGTFGNWAVVYLAEERGFSGEVAALALSVFWAALVLGRLLVLAALTRVPAGTIWLVLPLPLAAAALLLPHAATPPASLVVYGLAGLGCSAIVPLTVTLGAQRFAQHRAWVSSMLIGALMAGVGLGAFLVGVLRTAMEFDLIFRMSALYPLLMFALALHLVRRH